MCTNCQFQNASQSTLDPYFTSCCPMTNVKLYVTFCTVIVYTHTYIYINNAIPENYAGYQHHIADTQHLLFVMRYVLSHISLLSRVHRINIEYTFVYRTKSS